MNPESLAELAALQSTDPTADIDFIANHLRFERGGWKQQIPDDRVSIPVSNTVTVSFSIRDVVAALVAGYNETLPTSPKAEGFETFVRGLMERRPDLSESEARTVRLKQHSGATVVHARESARAFISLLPELMSLAVTKKPEDTTVKIPLAFEDAVKALLGTPPPTLRKPSKK